jgi:hypothetical protein
MRVACFVNPLVQASGPGFNYGGVETLAKLLQPLRREARCECMLITGGWFKEWARRNGKAHLLTGLRTIWLDELLLYRRIRDLGEFPIALDRAVHQADDAEQPALRVIAEVVARNVNGFEPDIIIGFAGQSNCLRKLWPTALRMHIERGYFGRHPYPVSFYFDHLGTHAGSAIARVGGLKLTYPVTSDGRVLVSRFRSQMAATFNALDPFRCTDLRSRCDRVCLLPLQVSNEFSFDGLVNYRTQFEYLYDVLAAAPKDIAVIVTEHPSGGPILRRSGPSSNIDLLRRTFPTMIFLDEFRRYQSSSQFLVPRVDGVWSVSSSVGYQALLFNRLLGSPPSTELSNVSDATTLADFFGQLGQHKPANVEPFLAWLLERYLVPETLVTDGRWFHDYLQRRLDAARSATSPIDAFVPTADADHLMDAWIAKASGPLTIKPLQWHDDPSIVELLANLHSVRRERDALLNSTSWRITAPLRFVKQAAVKRMRLGPSFPGGARAKQPSSAA